MFAESFLQGFILKKNDLGERLRSLNYLLLNFLIKLKQVTHTDRNIYVIFRLHYSTLLAVSHPHDFHIETDLNIFVSLGLKT